MLQRIPEENWNRNQNQKLTQTNHSMNLLVSSGLNSIAQFTKYGTEKGREKEGDWIEIEREREKKNTRKTMQ